MRCATTAEGRKGASASWIVVAIGVLLAVPTVAIGFYADDRLFVGLLDHRLTFDLPWWDLYRFVPTDLHAWQIAHGVIPWWSAPHLNVRFVRPLASALLALDHSLWGDAPLGYHLHSLVWWAALLVLARRAFEAWLPSPTSTLALAVYALATSHAYPVGWPSARHELVATVCVTGGLALMTGRGGESVSRRLAALAAFVLGLTASEGALGGLAFASLYDVAGPAARLKPLEVRLRRAAPWVLVAVVYLFGYAILGGGARDSGGYFSPISSPLRFVQVGILRYPVLLANALLGVPAEFSVVGGQTLLIVAGVVAAAVVAGAWRASRGAIEPAERDAIGWLLPGALITIVPCLGAFPGARVLELAEIGSAALVAVIVRHAFSRGPHALARRAVGGVLVAFHLALSPLGVLANDATTARIRQKTEAVAEQAAVAVRGADRAFYLAGSDPMASLYAPTVLASEGRAPPGGCWTWISGAKAKVRITRTSASTLLIEPLGMTLMHGPFETLYRDPVIAFHEGEGATVCGAPVTVSRVEGGLPASIELHLDDMESPTVALLAWQAGAIRKLTPPGVGTSIVIHR